MVPISLGSLRKITSALIFCSAWPSNRGSYCCMVGASVDQSGRLECRWRIYLRKPMPKLAGTCARPPKDMSRNGAHPRRKLPRIQENRPEIEPNEDAKVGRCFARFDCSDLFRCSSE